MTERKDENGELELAVDFEKLQQELSDDIIGKGEERYQFTWPDKRKANREANVRTTATLRPCREESVDFDNTLTLIEIKGSDLLEAFNGIATYGGEPVSSSVKLTIKDKSVYSLEIGGEPVQNDRTYKVATINYLIDATNYLSALRNYTSRRESGVYIYELMSDYVKSLGDQGIQLSSQLDGRVTVI